LILTLNNEKAEICKDFISQSSQKVLL